MFSDSIREKVGNSIPQLLFVSLLVGIIIAGVFVGTGFLQQSPKESHGPNGDHAGTNHVTIVSGSANVTANATVDYLNLTVAYGSTAINLSTVTITWLGPQGRETLIYGGRFTPQTSTSNPSDYFALVPLRDADSSAPVLTEADRFRLVMNVLSIRNRPLTAGQEIEMRLLTREGVTRVYTITLPSSLNGKSTVTV